MKTLWSGIGMVDGRGKLNGTVLSKNRYGNYARVKVTPVNPQTTDQQNRRGAFGNLAQLWPTLTEAQRQSWLEAASTGFPGHNIFGNPFDRQGNALFIGLNSNLFTIGEAPLTTAPASQVLGYPTLITLVQNTIASVQITVNFDDNTAIVPNGMTLVVQATPPVSAGRYFVKPFYRIIKNYAEGTAITAVELITEYSAQFGAPVVGKKIFVRVLAIHKTSGQASVAVATSSITL